MKNRLTRCLLVLLIAPCVPGTASLALVPEEFPEVEVLVKKPGRAPGLSLVTPYYSAPEFPEPVSFLAILNDEGAVHFQRRVSPPAHNFRWRNAALGSSRSWAEAVICLW